MHTDDTVITFKGPNTDALYIDTNNEVAKLLIDI